MSAYSDWKRGYLTDDEYRAAAERDADHIVLIRSDGSIVYEDDYITRFDDWDEEEIFEDDKIDEF